MAYLPQVGDMTTVHLPGEITRAEIRKVTSERTMIAELSSFTTAKDHPYKKGDLVPFRLKKNGLNQQIWEAIPEREITEGVRRVEAERAAAAEVESDEPEGPPVPPQALKDAVDGFVLGEN